MISDKYVEWFILLVCIITILIILLVSKIYPKYKSEHSHRWVTEALVGSILKRIFPEHTFVKVRPDFLKYPETRRNLELDFYCKELGVAIEYDGRQHYEYVPFFHKNNQENFVKQKQRDAFKRDACSRYGITLIEIPYTVHKEDLYNYITLKLVMAKII